MTRKSLAALCACVLCVCLLAGCAQKIAPAKAESFEQTGVRAELLGFWPKSLLFIYTKDTTELGAEVVSVAVEKASVDGKEVTPEFITELGEYADYYYEDEFLGIICIRQDYETVLRGYKTSLTLRITYSDGSTLKFIQDGEYDSAGGFGGL